MKLKGIKLQPNSKLSRRNLSHADLEDVNLSDSDLSEANLGYANLTNANLTNADLSHANLSCARLVETRLSGARLTNCNMFGVSFTSGFGETKRQTDLSVVDLREVKIQFSNFTYGDFDGVDLSLADLTRSDFTGARFRRAKFAGTNLERAKLVFFDGRDVDLRWANLEGADLSGSNFSGADFSKAKLRNAKCSSSSGSTKADFTDTKFCDSNLTNFSLWNVILNRTEFTGAVTDGLKIFEDQLNGVINLDLSRAIVYDRKTSKPIVGFDAKGTFIKSRDSGRSSMPPFANAKMPDDTTYDAPDQKVSLSTSNSSARNLGQVTQSIGDEKEETEVKLFLCNGIDFSHAAGVPFSLKTEMNKAGFGDIGDFFRQLTKIIEDPAVLVDLSKRIANDIDKDYFRVVVARLLNAVSYNSEIVKDADIKKWLIAAELAGFGVSSQRRLSEPFFNIVHRVVLNSIRTYGLQGLDIVRQLEVGAIAWEQVSDGKSVFGDDADVARSLLVAVVLQSILHSLKSAQSSQHVIESLSGTKGQNVSPREDLRLMTELGRQYARANGINYDDFVRRHAGIE